MYYSQAHTFFKIPIAVNPVESVVKYYCFRRHVNEAKRSIQYNAESTLSPCLCVKPLITAITIGNQASASNNLAGLGADLGGKGWIEWLATPLWRSKKIKKVKNIVVMRKKGTHSEKGT